MFGCRKYQGLIAASLYEELTERERHTLDKHLASCEACRADAQALAGLVAAVPAVQPALDRDLAPALRARLRESSDTSRAVFFPRWALLAGAACVVLFMAFFLGSDKTAHAPGPQAPEMAAIGADAEKSPLESSLAQADALIETREFTQAYSLLENELREHADDTLAGIAQERLADLAFSKLEWYDKAYDAYAALARSYGSTYQANRTNIDRLNLLDEARKVEYASLRAYGAARQDRTDAIAQLQEVISAYPSTYVASMAAGDIGRVSAGAGATVGERLQAMTTVRDASQDPVVVAQLDLEIGHIHRDERNDLGTARECYVRASENPVIARLANDALHNLESPSSR